MGAPILKSEGPYLGGSPYGEIYDVVVVVVQG